MSKLVRCGICGEDNPKVIEKHHKFPRRFGGPDTDDNIIKLCANCHRCIENEYDNEFWAAAFDQFRMLDEHGDDMPSLETMEKEIEDELIKRIRYEIVNLLDNEDYSHTEIAQLIEKMETVDTLSRRRVSQLTNGGDFQDVYTSSNE